MIGKNRPGFLAGQPEHTVPQGEAGWLGSRRRWRRRESSWGQQEQRHRTVLPRKHWGDAQECPLRHGLSWEGRGRAHASLTLGMEQTRGVDEAGWREEAKVVGSKGGLCSNRGLEPQKLRRERFKSSQASTPVQVLKNQGVACGHDLSTLEPSSANTQVAGINN